MILRRSSRETSMLMEPSMACGECEAKNERAFQTIEER